MPTVVRTTAKMSRVVVLLLFVVGMAIVDAGPPAVVPCDKLTSGAAGSSSSLRLLDVDEHSADGDVIIQGCSIADVNINITASRGDTISVHVDATVMERSNIFFWSSRALALLRVVVSQSKLLLNHSTASTTDTSSVVLPALCGGNVTTTGGRHVLSALVNGGIGDLQIVVSSSIINVTGNTKIGRSQCSTALAIQAFGQRDRPRVIGSARMAFTHSRIQTASSSATGSGFETAATATVLGFDQLGSIDVSIGPEAYLSSTVFTIGGNSSALVLEGDVTKGGGGLFLHVGGLSEVSAISPSAQSGSGIIAAAVLRSHSEAVNVTFVVSNASRVTATAAYIHAKAVARALCVVRDSSLAVVKVPWTVENVSLIVDGASVVAARGLRGSVMSVVLGWPDADPFTFTDVAVRVVGTTISVRGGSEVRFESSFGLATLYQGNDIATAASVFIVTPRSVSELRFVAALYDVTIDVTGGSFVEAMAPLASIPAIAAAVVVRGNGKAVQTDVTLTGLIIAIAGSSTIHVRGFSSPVSRSEESTAIPSLAMGVCVLGGGETTANSFSASLNGIDMSVTSGSVVLAEGASVYAAGGAVHTQYIRSGVGLNATDLTLRISDDANVTAFSYDPFDDPQAVAGAWVVSSRANSYNLPVRLHGVTLLVANRAVVMCAVSAMRRPNVAWCDSVSLVYLNSRGATATVEDVFISLDNAATVSAFMNNSVFGRSTVAAVVLDASSSGGIRDQSQFDIANVTLAATRGSIMRALAMTQCDAFVLAVVLGANAQKVDASVEGTTIALSGASIVSVTFERDVDSSVAFAIGVGFFGEGLRVVVRHVAVSVFVDAQVFILLNAGARIRMMAVSLVASGIDSPATTIIVSHIAISISRNSSIDVTTSVTLPQPIMLGVASAVGSDDGSSVRSVQLSNFTSTMQSSSRVRVTCARPSDVHVMCIHVESRRNSTLVATDIRLLLQGASSIALNGSNGARVLSIGTVADSATVDVERAVLQVTQYSNVVSVSRAAADGSFSKALAISSGGSSSQLLSVRTTRIELSENSTVDLSSFGPVSALALTIKDTSKHLQQLIADDVLLLVSGGCHLTLTSLLQPAIDGYVATLTMQGIDSDGSQQMPIFARRTVLSRVAVIVVRSTVISLSNEVSAAMTFQSSDHPDSIFENVTVALIDSKCVFSQHAGNGGILLIGSIYVAAATGASASATPRWMRRVLFAFIRSDILVLLRQRAVGYFGSSVGKDAATTARLANATWLLCESNVTLRSVDTSRPQGSGGFILANGSSFANLEPLVESGVHTSTINAPLSTCFGIPALLSTTGGQRRSISGIFGSNLTCFSAGWKITGSQRAPPVEDSVLNLSSLAASASWLQRANASSSVTPSVTLTISSSTSSSPLEDVGVVDVPFCDSLLSKEQRDYLQQFASPPPTTATITMFSTATATPTAVSTVVTSTVTEGSSSVLETVTESASDGATRQTAAPSDTTKAGGVLSVTATLPISSSSATNGSKTNNGTTMAMASPTTTSTTLLPSVPPSAASAAAIVYRAQASADVFTATATVSTVAAAFSPSDVLQGSRLFSGLRVGACREGDSVAAPDLNATKNASTVFAVTTNDWLPFPRALVPFRVHGNPFLGAVIGNIAVVTLVAVASFAYSTWFKKRSSSFDHDESSLPWVRWNKGGFPASALSATLMVVDGTAFAGASLLLRNGPGVASTSADVIVGVIGLGWSAAVVVVATFVQIRSPLQFGSVEAWEAAATGVSRWLVRRRGRWVPPAVPSALPPAMELPPSSSPAVGWGPGSTHYFAAFRPFIASVRGGPGVLERCARFGTAASVFFTAASAVNEAWGHAVVCGTNVAEDPLAVNVAIAAVAALFDCVVAPHAHPVKAVLHGICSALALVVAVFVQLSRMAESSAAKDSKQRYATYATQTAFVASAFGVVGVVVGAAGTILRRRLRRKAAASAELRPDQATAVALLDIPLVPINAASLVPIAAMPAAPPPHRVAPENPLRRTSD